MRYTGPKDRLSRREGFDLFGKGPKLTRINVFPGVHGPKGGSGSSQYGKQLREKQKVKRLYGITETQFRKYVETAFKIKGNTGQAILLLLEKRLDNVVYRLGFAPTRSSARQLVGHGHVLVNDRKINIASYQVHINDSIMIDAKAISIPEVEKALEVKDIKIPEWLQRKAVVGKITKNPAREDIGESINEQDIVEFYSR